MTVTVAMTAEDRVEVILEGMDALEAVPVDVVTVVALEVCDVPPVTDVNDGEPLPMLDGPVGT